MKLDSKPWQRSSEGGWRWCLRADMNVQCLSLSTHINSELSNPPLALKWASPPAALSLETPAHWSFSPFFISTHPFSNLPLSSLVPLSLPNFSWSPSFIPPLPSHALSYTCFTSISPLFWYLTCWCCPLRASDCLWVRVEQKSGARSLQCRATKHHPSTVADSACELVCTVCVHI